MQTVRTWRRGGTTSSLEYYLESLITEGYTIEQVITTKYTGNELFKVTDSVVVVCSRSAYHEEEQQQ